MGSDRRSGTDELLLGSSTLRELADAERELPEGEARELEANRAALSAFAAATVEPTSPGDALRARVVASMARTVRFGRYVDRLARLYDLSPDAIEAVLATVDDPLAWQPGFIEGMWMLPITPGPRARATLSGLVKFLPGVSFPDHGHVGDEITFVLQGGFRDNTGRELWRGEEQYLPAGSHHAYEVLSGEECIAASLVYGGIEMRR